MKIELLYFDGCPNHLQAFEDLEKVLKELRIEEEIDRVNILDNDNAIKHRFLGSPSIRINDRDLEIIEDDSTEYSMRCRRYKNGDLMEGFPSKELIRMKLSSIRED